MEAPMGPNTPLGPPPPGVKPDFSNPVNHERYAQFIATLAVFFALSSVCVLLRTYTRIVIKQFGWDDGFALVSMALNVVMTVNFAEQVRYGIADYDWNVRAIEWLTNDSDSYNFWNAVGSLVFYIVYALLKMSILFLFLRLLGPTRRVLRICVFALMFIVCAGTLSSIIVVLKMCDPVEKLFHPTTTPGTCVFNSTIFVAQAFFSVATDILILVPPIPLIWNLPMSFKRKVGLAINLSLGLVVTAVAIVRAITWNSGVKYVLYDNYYGLYWAIIEVNLALAAVCLPALTQLFRRQRQRSRSSKDSPGERGRKQLHSDPSSEGSGPLGKDAPRIPTLAAFSPFTSRIEPGSHMASRMDHGDEEKWHTESATGGDRSWFRS